MALTEKMQLDKVLTWQKAKDLRMDAQTIKSTLEFEAGSQISQIHQHAISAEKQLILNGSALPRTQEKVLEKVCRTARVVKTVVDALTEGLYLGSVETGAVS